MPKRVGRSTESCRLFPRCPRQSDIVFDTCYDGNHTHCMSRFDKEPRALPVWRAVVPENPASLLEKRNGIKD